jgi:hypothetical protein
MGVAQEPSVDDCIRTGLVLPRRQEVAIVTLTLSLCREFDRTLGECGAKGHVGLQEKLVTRTVAN